MTAAALPNGTPPALMHSTKITILVALDAYRSGARQNLESCERLWPIRPDGRPSVLVEAARERLRLADEAIAAAQAMESTEP